jgi:hypothetical protein
LRRSAPPRGLRPVEGLPAQKAIAPTKLRT